MNFKQILWGGAVASFALGLTACGGGGGDSSASGSSVTVPSAPALTVQGSLKAVNIGWSAISGATSYKVFYDATGSSGYTQLGADLSASSVSARIPVSVHLQDWQNSRFMVQACNSAGCTASSALTPLTAMLDTIAYVKASNTAADSTFGFSTAMSGDGKTLIVGAPYVKDDISGVTNGVRTLAGTGTDNHGAVYVYRLGADGNWTQQAYLKASNILDAEDNEQGGFSAEFGTSVAISNDGSTVAVGAAAESSSAVGINGDQTDYTLTDAGAVYIFGVGTDSKWTQKAYIKPSNTRDNLRFGASVALDSTGSALVAGAPSEDSAATGINGSQSSAGVVDSGAAYFFTRNNVGVWSQQAYIKPSNTRTSFGFGGSVALANDGKTLAIGASGENGAAKGINGNQAVIGQENNGAVYLFARNNTGLWLQQAYIKASNTPQVTDPADSGSEFGSQVALSGDGKTLAVGAPWQDSDNSAVAFNDNSSNLGAVYVYKRSAADVWSQQSMLKTTATGNFSEFGRSVALSNDGNFLAAGATGDATPARGVNGALTVSGGQADAGSVFVFTASATGWNQKSYVKASNTYSSTQVLSSPTIRPQFGNSIAISADGSTLAVGAAGEYGSGKGVATGSNNRLLDVTAAGAGAVYVY